MPFRYHRYDANRLLRVTLEDPVTLDELKASVDRQLREGAWSYRLLVDARAMMTNAQPVDIRAFQVYVHDLETVHGPRGRVAIVAKTTSAVSGGQIFKVLGESDAIDVFWDIDDANQWLDDKSDDH